MTEEVQEALTIRGLQDDFGTPLRKFTGRLDSYGVEQGKPAMLNFTELEVIASIEPYPFPSGVIEIWPSTRVKSKRGVFGTSLGKFIQPHEDLRDCIGKVIGMEMTEGHMLPKKDDESGEWKNVPMSAWEVFSVDGMQLAADGSAPAAKTPAERAMELLDGAGLGEFNQKAMADTVIRDDPTLLQQIVGKTFAQSLLDAGVFTKDQDDVYHRV